MSAFNLHPQLAADTLVVGDLPLCRVLLMNDCQYPWLILVPRRGQLRELYELDETDLAQFYQESCQVGRRLMVHFAGDKLNVAALGNMVPQLHVHHIVRFQQDPAWPAPVWGKLPARPYESAQLAELKLALQQLLAPVGLSPL
ncbi:HIT domain-containing protein [Balneatrix alpica]|uniref:HIT domain-containing protein n=1 Tax=Balneatrix alpica TaxID=75684 RepID=A0ABV5Z6R4_9GAMM|nr:HIT domain-containing protein [Balneatrix alpica]